MASGRYPRSCRHVPAFDAGVLARFVFWRGRGVSQRLVGAPDHCGWTLPEPLTLVTQISLLQREAHIQPLRLFAGRRADDVPAAAQPPRLGYRTSSLLPRYWPVSEVGRPAHRPKRAVADHPLPCSPAPGPRSTIQSAADGVLVVFGPPAPCCSRSRSPAVRVDRRRVCRLRAGPMLGSIQDVS